MSKEELILEHIKNGVIYNFGSDESELHENLKEKIPKIIGVDLYGTPDIKLDLNSWRLGLLKPANTIICCEVIEHLLSPLTFLMQMKSLLKRNGRIILTTPNALSIAEFMGQVRYKGLKDSKYTGHIYNWKKQNMDLLIDQAGLKVRHFEYMDNYHNRRIIKSLVKYIPILRPKLFYVITK